MPEIESAFVAADTTDGAIRALVGGFDFNRNKFNHVTQAWRQPGSAIKPFVYSAALEKGYNPGTLILDPGQFYILASKEAVHVPADHAAEMTPFDPLVGEFRVHYAGFFDPGFGHAPAGGEGAGGRAARLP